MATRNLRVDKWLGKVPAVGVCTECGKNFKVPESAKRTSGRTGKPPPTVRRTRVRGRERLILDSRSRVADNDTVPPEAFE